MAEVLGPAFPAGHRNSPRVTTIPTTATIVANLLDRPLAATVVVEQELLMEVVAVLMEEADMVVHRRLKRN